MASANLTALQGIKSNILARLAELTASKFATVQVQGQTVQKTEYFRAMMDELKTIDEQIRYQELKDDGPFEIEQRMYS